MLLIKALIRMRKRVLVNASEGRKISTWVSPLGWPQVELKSAVNLHFYIKFIGPAMTHSISLKVTLLVQVCSKPVCSIYVLHLRSQTFVFALAKCSKFQVKYGDDWFSFGCFKHFL